MAKKLVKKSKQIKNVHPSIVLDEEFLWPLRLTASQLGDEAGISKSMLSEILNCKCRITVNTAVKLGRYFNNSPQFWKGLQTDYDIELETKLLKNALKTIKPFSNVKSPYGNHTSTPKKVSLKKI